MLEILNQPAQIHKTALIYGNTLRLGILHHLNQGSYSRSELSDLLGVSETNLSRQIKFLNDEGLIITTILPGRGRPTRYSLDHQVAKELEQAFLQYIHGGEMETSKQSPA